MLPGFFQQRLHLWLVLPLLDRQDRQAVEGHAHQGRQLVLLRIGQQLFIGLLGPGPGVLEAIGPPQADVEVLDLGGRKPALREAVAP